MIAPRTCPRTCPFCDAPAEARVCASCKRDTTAARRPCQSCGKMIPLQEKRCSHCGVSQSSELGWKIPLIVAMFVVAFILAILLRAA